MENIHHKIKFCIYTTDHIRHNHAFHVPNISEFDCSLFE